MSAMHTTRSKQTVKMVREEVGRNGKIRVIEADLPCGPGWMNGNPGTIDWQNLKVGWQPYDVYYAKKNSEQSQATREALIETANDAKAMKAQAEADRIAALEAELAAEKIEVGAKKPSKEKVK